VILVDTSAWIEFLRATNTSADQSVQEALAGEIATCDPVRMELLAGARSDRNPGDLRGLLSRAVHLSTRPSDYDDAALLYRRARASGLTVRRLVDCLIAAIAIRHDVPVLHADRDFTALAECSTLRAIERP
jgi:predicted nucleic acid-binding protein